MAQTRIAPSSLLETMPFWPSLGLIKTHVLQNLIYANFSALAALITLARVSPRAQQENLPSQFRPQHLLNDEHTARDEADLPERLAKVDTRLEGLAWER